MNKARRGDGIAAEILQILKDDSVKVLHSKCQQNLENSTVATGLEKVSFHSNPKERQCQRMLKLPHNCTHITRQKSNAQNSPCQASTICELRNSRCSSWLQKRQRNQRSNANIHWITEKAREFQAIPDKLTPEHSAWQWGSAQYTEMLLSLLGVEAAQE